MLIIILICLLICQFCQSLSTFAKITTGLLSQLIQMQTPILQHFDIPNIGISTLMISNEIELKQFSLYSKGMNSLTSGEFDKALNIFNEAIELDTNNPDIYISRGITYEKILKWDEAINDYNKANRIYKSQHFNQDDPVCLSNIANARTGLNQWKEALIDYNKAISLKSNYLAPQIGRAYALYQLDRKEEAYNFFKLLSSQYPSFPDGIAALAVMEYEKGLYDLAFEDWNDALEEDSRYIDIEWVRDIRRWPPNLVNELVNFKTYITNNKLDKK